MSYFSGLKLFLSSGVAEQGSDESKINRTNKEGVDEVEPDLDAAQLILAEIARRRNEENGTDGTGQA